MLKAIHRIERLDAEDLDASLRLVVNPVGGSDSTRAAMAVKNAVLANAISAEDAEERIRAAMTKLGTTRRDCEIKEMFFRLFEG